MSGVRPTVDPRGHLARWVLLLAVAGVAALAFPDTGPAPVRALPLDLLVLAPLWLLLAFYRRETYADLRQLVALATIIAVTVVGAAVLHHLAPDRPELTPIPLAAMLVTMLWNGRIAVSAAAVLALLIGIQSVFVDDRALVFGLLGGTAGALGIRVLRRRRSMYLAVALTAGGYFLAALAFGILEAQPVALILASTGYGALVAVGSAAVAVLVLPLLEQSIHVTTDLTLLELADPSRPLLRRLATEAPGTWAHSVAMANLCESACEAIGANGLLARVGCYYHDVGKLGSPAHFVENQGRGANPHDALAPAESARIITDHVAVGVTLAARYGLPAVVADFIREHHGTTRVEYFLDRARRAGGEPDPAGYTYPGPTPRRAETAIAMLADSAEAAVRVLDDPSPESVRTAIDTLVARKIATGQLDDAPLTLRDLARIKAEFARILGGMKHHRVDYPAAAGGISGEVPAVRS
ncbi:MAG TPA: HDIG domain-containing protein [Gemmatimonadales bacterium]|nr:HDIG domain-containing protein [Gemmatimonadales bacterium]